MAKHTNSTQLVDSSSVHTYRLGLIDPSTLVPVRVEPLDAPCFTLLVPGQDVFLSLLVDPAFHAGANCGYYSGDIEAELEDYVMASPAKVVNWIWKNFSTDLCEPDCSRAWLVGYLLGTLTGLAETDETLALVGLNHLSFLLSLVPALSFPRLYTALSAAGSCHAEAVRAYRAAVSFHKASGLDFLNASRAALAGLHYASAFALDAAESEVA